MENAGEENGFKTLAPECEGPSFLAPGHRECPGTRAVHRYSVQGPRSGYWAVRI